MLPESSINGLVDWQISIIDCKCIRSSCSIPWHRETHTLLLQLFMKWNNVIYRPHAHAAETPIHRNALAGHVTSCGTGQECDETCHETKSWTIASLEQAQYCASDKVQGKNTDKICNVRLLSLDIDLCQRRSKY